MLSARVLAQMVGGSQAARWRRWISVRGRGQESILERQAPFNPTDQRIGHNDDLGSLECHADMNVFQNLFGIFGADQNVGVKAAGPGDAFDLQRPPALPRSQPDLNRSNDLGSLAP